MKVIEASGDARTIGQCTGEALRDEIRLHMEKFPRAGDPQAWERRLPAFLDALKDYVPRVLEEMEGLAQGADLALDAILKLNLPMYPNELDLGEGCTNIAFAGGADGPVWGKNNDGDSPGEQRPVCACRVRRADGIPLLTFTFCGMVAVGDGMNAEGLAAGHSSVGSIFQQSDHHVPIRLWAYEGMLHCRTTAEFARHMAAVPTRGKGYSILCVDRQGATCSIEAACPMMQVRRPAGEVAHMHCVNCYQLPALADADRRSEDGKRNAFARWRFLDDELSKGTGLSLEDMKRLLRHHGDPSICRHGGDDGGCTEYSMIGLPQSGRVLVLDGPPCENEYEAITV